jgi:hypothetical protein
MIMVNDANSSNRQLRAVPFAHVVAHDIECHFKIVVRHSVPFAHQREHVAFAELGLSARNKPATAKSRENHKPH